MKVIRKSEQKTSNWSGGTTREIFIYPNNSSYAERDFFLRISTATVDTPSSSFTYLPGVNRLLMILRGTLIIKHVGHYTKELEVFDQDKFDGGWKTTSIGKVVDFNLMLTKGTGELIPYQSNTEIENFTKKHATLYFLYIHSGVVAYKDTTATSGDILLWNEIPDTTLFKAAENTMGVLGAYEE